MISRKDWKLRKLGIIPWKLKYPIESKRATYIVIPSYVRLIIVMKKKSTLHCSIIRDVLRTLSISLNQVLQITSDQLVMLPRNYCCNSWRIGVTEEISLDGRHLISPSLDKFIENPSIKRELWKQICKYEHDLFRRNK